MSELQGDKQDHGEGYADLQKIFVPLIDIYGPSLSGGESKPTRRATRKLLGWCVRLQAPSLLVGLTKIQEEGEGRERDRSRFCVWCGPGRRKGGRSCTFIRTKTDMSVCVQVVDLRCQDGTIVSDHLGLEFVLQLV